MTSQKCMARIHDLRNALQAASLLVQANHPAAEIEAQHMLMSKIINMLWLECLRCSKCDEEIDP